VNGAIIRATLQTRLKSRIRLLLLAAITLPMLAGQLFFPQPKLIDGGVALFIVWILGTGVIGQDISSGVIQMVFARPVRRWEYVLSKWTALAGGALAITLVMGAVSAVLLIARGAPPETTELLRFAAEALVTAVGAAAALVMFSSIMPGHADLALYVPFFFTSWILGMLGTVESSELLRRISEEIGNFVMPAIDIEKTFASDPISWFVILSYLSNVSILLLLAVVILNRREFSYASG
jgi:ABC-type transport system involved in multi-copper enzyme maturation permease subunit